MEDDRCAGEATVRESGNGPTGRVRFGFSYNPAQRAQALRRSAFSDNSISSLAPLVSLNWSLGVFNGACFVGAKQASPRGVGQS